jgi:H+-transporting ATPase
MAGSQSGTDKFADLPLDEVLRQLQTDSTAGLSGSEANKRLREFGSNEVAEKKQNAAVVFL